MTELYAVKGTSITFTWSNLHGDKGNSRLYEDGVEIHETGGGYSYHSYTYTYDGVGTKVYYAVLKKTSIMLLFTGLMDIVVQQLKLR